MKIPGILLLTVFLAGCKANSENGITGTWLMHEVFQDGEDVTSEHDPYDERFMIFREDSTFESGGRPFGRNTGRYVYDSADKTLFLDSDAGTEDDSQWKVRIQGDTMHWQGYGSEWAEAFELIQVRER